MLQQKITNSTYSALHCVYRMIYHLKTKINLFFKGTLMSDYLRDLKTPKDIPLLPCMFCLCQVSTIKLHNSIKLPPNDKQLVGVNTLCIS